MDELESGTGRPRGLTPEAPRCTAPEVHGRRLRRKLFIGLLVLLWADLAPGAIADEQVEAGYYARWLDEVDFLIEPTERQLFEELSTDREREEFIQRFWEARAGSGANAARLRWSSNAALARAELGRLDDDRARLALLEGPPTYVSGFDRDDDVTEPCGVLRPLQIFYYSSAPAKDRFYAVFTPSFAGSPRYRRWRRHEGLETLLAWRRGGLHEALLRMPFEAGWARALDLVEEGGCFRDRPSLRGILEAASSSETESIAETEEPLHEIDLGWIDRFRDDRAVNRSIDDGGPQPVAFEVLATQIPAGEETLLDLELRLPAEIVRTLPAARGGYASVVASLEATMRNGTADPIEALSRRYWVPVEPAAPEEPVSLPLAASLPPGSYQLVVRLFAGETHGLRRVISVEIPPVSRSTTAPRIANRSFPAGSASHRAPGPVVGAPIDAGAATVAAADAAGDELTLSGGAHRLRVKLRALPEPEPKSGKALVVAEFDLPIGGRLDRLDFLLADRELGSLREGPWVWRFRLLPEKPTVIRARATLVDGRVGEDAMVIGGAGIAERVDVRLVELYVTAQDRRRRPVPDLALSDLVVLEDGEPQRVVELTAASSLPISIATLADASSTMLEEVDLERAAAMQFFENVLRENDRGAFLVFNHRLEIVVPFTDDLAWLEDGTSALRAAGGTSLWDSLIYTMQYVAGWSGRRAVVVLTDGHDESSRSTYGAACELARRAGVPIFPIHLDWRPTLPSELRDPGATRRDLAVDRLRSLARESGGTVHRARSESDLDDAFAAIERSLRAQYRIVYASSHVVRTEGVFRSVEVRVRRPGISLRAGAGYVAD